MIVQLTPDDVAAWREIRLEALRVAPVAFTESYETAAAKTDAQYANDIQKNTIFSWRDAQAEIGGVLGFYVQTSLKTSHRGTLWSMYVREQFRGRGIASQLMEAAIDYARGRVSQLHLGVDSAEGAAVALYRKHGFTIYGTDPRALLIDGVYYDEYLMVKML